MAKRKPSPPVEPYRVFLSHATYDKFLAVVLTDRIESAPGLSVFRDDRDIEGGDNIPNAVRQAIRDCREMVVLFTPESVGREWVTLEVGMAQILDRRVVPLLYHVEPDALPATLREAKAYRLEELDLYLTGLAARAAETPDD